MAKKTSARSLDAEEAPQENMPPLEKSHTNGEQKSSTHKQLNRPVCGLCGEPMHAVSSQVRAHDGPMTYYQCKDEGCPEKALLPVPRTEVMKYLEQNSIANQQKAGQLNVAARPNMKGTG